MDATDPAEPPSPLLVTMRQNLLFCYTVFCGIQAWLQIKWTMHDWLAGLPVSWLGHGIVFTGSGALAVLGTYNMYFLKNPQSRLYLFRWMST